MSRSEFSKAGVDAKGGIECQLNGEEGVVHLEVGMFKGGSLCQGRDRILGTFGATVNGGQELCYSERSVKSSSPSSLAFVQRVPEST